MNSENLRRLCHVCSAGEIHYVDSYFHLQRITSDCTPWPAGGHLGVCRKCGCVQKSIDSSWEAETRDIYAGYSIYHQGGGAEQAVFDVASGQVSGRSERLLDCLRIHYPLPISGRLLDVGCGNGGLLRAFGRIASQWSMTGIDLNEKHRRYVEAIKGVERFYSCGLEDIPGEFDLITMVHLLEHIACPRSLLVNLRRRLSPSGLVLIEVPEYLQNPFDLLIADHAIHFTSRTLVALLRSAGYDTVSVSSSCVPKELTVIARSTSGPVCGDVSEYVGDELVRVRECLLWLEWTLAASRELRRGGRLGLLGTSIAATWLFTELNGAVDFFVDEDQNRTGKDYLGRPVYHPSGAPEDSDIFIPLPPTFAEPIAKRLASAGKRYHCPPPFPRIET